MGLERGLSTTPRPSPSKGEGGRWTVDLRVWDASCPLSFPRRGLGSGSFFGSESLNRLPDRPQDPFKIVVNLRIAKAQHNRTHRLNVSLPRRIVFLGFSPIVRWPINLDRELQFGGIKIDDEAINAILATEFAVLKTALAQVGPEMALGGGHRLAEMTAQVGEFSAVIEFGHGMKNRAGFS
jgi:hypothetical protein